MTDRKKPGVAFWTTVALVVVLLYVASIGPAWLLVNVPWVDENAPVVYDLYQHLYGPIFVIADGSEPIHDGILWYAKLFTSVLADN